MMAMPVDIVPIEEIHIDGFHRTLNIVARERRYLAYPEGSPIETTRAFVRDDTKRGFSHLVAISAGKAVGWCDVTAKPRPIYAHAGVLGMGGSRVFGGRQLVPN
jgi:hypothetical protein